MALPLIYRLSLHSYLLKPLLAPGVQAQGCAPEVAHDLFSCLAIFIFFISLSLFSNVVFLIFTFHPDAVVEPVCRKRRCFFQLQSTIKALDLTVVFDVTV